MAAVKEIIKFILEGLRELGIAEFTHRTAVEKPGMKKREGRRREMLAYITTKLKLMPGTIGNFERRMAARLNKEQRTYEPKAPYPPNSKNTAVNLLGELYHNLSGENEKDIRDEVFKHILETDNDQQFDLWIDLLENDSVRQNFHKIWWSFKRCGGGIQMFFEKLWPEIKKTDPIVAEKLRNLRSWLNSKGVK